MNLLVLGSPGYDDPDVVFDLLETDFRSMGGELVSVINRAEGRLGEWVNEIVQANEDLGWSLDPNASPDEALVVLLPDDPVPETGLDVVCVVRV